MTTIRLPARGAALLATAILLIAGCASGTTEARTDSATEAAEASQGVTEDTATESASPTEEPVETSAVGEAVQLPSADFTVRGIEERDMIPSSFPDYTPGEGERLWFLDIEWTNNTLDAVAKECHGPDMFDLRVYDLDGAEMLMVDQPGMIEGQECSSGLRQGETGTWYTAFYGGTSDFGWAIFTDYAGEEAVVTLDPTLELTRTL
ncbi:hypothetical protein [Brachybacterium paraconglomeratum]|uniref:hypothetical protein n=1 Tax=Brachybacterium paraconglomeratum TaxID=173362 RepID=UPI0022E816F2|nr:hypothetical protein [Brachybacterium paraconglomeratum]